MDDEEYKQLIFSEMERIKKQFEKQRRQRLILQLAYLILVLVMIGAATVQIIYPKTFGPTNVVMGVTNIGVSILTYLQYLECTLGRKWKIILLLASILNMYTGVTKLI